VNVLVKQLAEAHCQVMRYVADDSLFHYATPGAEHPELTTNIQLQQCSTLPPWHCEPDTLHHLPCTCKAKLVRHGSNASPS
jgi:hypothetical protein